MSTKDKLMMKLMTNKVLLKIISIPIVVKILTIETKAFMWLVSLFSRKKAQPDQAHPSQ